MGMANLRIHFPLTSLAWLVFLRNEISRIGFGGYDTTLVAGCLSPALSHKLARPVVPRISPGIRWKRAWSISGDGFARLSKLKNRRFNEEGVLLPVDAIMVEIGGFEPPTSALRTQRSPN